MKFETYLYVKVIQKIKKMLRYLHQRLQQVMVQVPTGPNGGNNMIVFRPYETNKVFYINFFNCIMTYYQNSKQKFKDLKPLIDQIRANCILYKDHIATQLP